MGNQVCGSCQNTENRSEIRNEGGASGIRVREKGLKNEEIDYSDSTFNIWDAGGMSTFQSQNTFTNLLSTNPIILKKGSLPKNHSSPSHRVSDHLINSGSIILKSSSRQVPLAIAEESEFETIADDINNTFKRKCSIDEELEKVRDIKSDKIVEHEEVIRQPERMTKSNENQKHKMFELNQEKRQIDENKNNQHNSDIKSKQNEIKLGQYLPGVGINEALISNHNQNSPMRAKKSNTLNPKMDPEISNQPTKSTQSHQAKKFTPLQEFLPNSGDTELKTPTASPYPPSFSPIPGQSIYSMKNMQLDSTEYNQIYQQNFDLRD